jgi:hypothetical protein
VASFAPERPRDSHRAAHKYLLEVFAVVSRLRGGDLSWIETERQVMCEAADLWAEHHGVPGRVDIEEVERCEAPAIGHSDYGTKWALGIAFSLHSMS